MVLLQLHTHFLPVFLSMGFHVRIAGKEEISDEGSTEEEEEDITLD